MVNKYCEKTTTNKSFKKKHVEDIKFFLKKKKKKKLQYDRDQTKNLSEEEK